MIDLLKSLFPINRSLTGQGVRKTLSRLEEEIGEIQITEVSSGTKVFDWTVPDEWNIDEAYILTPSGDRICDYQVNNLHLVGYSIPIETKLSLAQLQLHLFHLRVAERNPYITSYYKRTWGFYTYEDRLKLEDVNMR